MIRLFKELKRRNVIRVALLYLVSSWLILQVADVLSGLLSLPDWTLRLVGFILLLGFPVALVFSWVYELTPEGLKREKQIVDGSSVTAETGRKLNVVTLIVAVLAIGLVAWQQIRPTSAPYDEAARHVSAPTTHPAEEAPKRSGNSIAVLPFVNRSADPENEYFADGLSEELLNQLSQIPELMVAGRTSSFSFKGRNEDLRAIGSALGVTNILEGSVRRQGDQVRVTAQLIRVGDGFHLWSDDYDRQIDDVFAIQDDIAASVARAMRIVLDDAAWTRMQEVGVRNVDAFVAFQKGKALFLEAHGSAPLIPTLRTGMRFFDEAVAAAPEFGTAYWAMSDYYAHLIMDPETPRFDRGPALRDLRRVLGLAWEFSRDPNRKAFIDVDRVFFSDDWTTLRDRIERALATTGCPDPTWIEIATVIGYAERSRPMWERYARCEPLNWIGHLNVAVADYFSGEPEATLAQIERIEERFGINPYVSRWKQMALLSLGRPEDALALAGEVIGDRSYFGMSAEAIPLAAAGRPEEARAAARRWAAERGSQPTSELEIHAALGEREQANALASAIDALPGGPFELLTFLHTCACGAPFDIEATPLLNARLAEARIPWPPTSLVQYPAKDW